MSRRGLLSLALLLSFGVGGCQTLRSWHHGCAAAYSGVRFYSDQLDWLPWDGKVFFTIDLPISAVVDTVALPATAFLDPEAPPEGFVRGCRWADAD